MKMIYFDPGYDLAPVITTVSDDDLPDRLWEIAAADGLGHAVLSDADTAALAEMDPASQALWWWTGSTEQSPTLQSLLEPIPDDTRARRLLFKVPLDAGGLLTITSLLDSSATPSAPAGPHAPRHTTPTAHAS